MIINSIIAGTSGASVNKKVYNITAEQTWTAFFNDCNFQLLYKNSTVVFSVTGATAPSAGATTTLLYFTHRNNANIKSMLYRNSLGTTSNPCSPNTVNSSTVNFSSQTAAATIADAYYGISSTGIVTRGASNIGSLIPNDATVTITEAPLSDDLWGS